MCVCVRSLTGRGHGLLGADYSNELDNGAGVCILICACLWGFIMGSLNLPYNELYSGSECVSLSIFGSQYHVTTHAHFSISARNVSSIRNIWL